MSQKKRFFTSLKKVIFEKSPSRFFCNFFFLQSQDQVFLLQRSDATTENGFFCFNSDSLSSTLALALTNSNWSLLYCPVSVVGFWSPGLKNGTGHGQKMKTALTYCPVLSNLVWVHLPACTANY